VNGFFGIVRQDGKPIEERFLDAIAEQLSFRGPNGRNVWKQNHVGGCFTWMQTGPARQASQQPVNWRDRFWLWGDLRLDARNDLLQQLADDELATETNLTSETLLLRAWAKWGVACLERVIGDFSFVLWDAKEDILWCARDFVGPRPFYYSQTPEMFCFANTLHILRSVPEISDDLDESFLGDFLIEGWNVEPARTVYRDIKRLPAGHLLKLSNRNISVRRFRKLPIEEPLHLKRPEEYLEAYRDLVKLAVSDRLPEGETSLYLSGGLDSSSVSAVASQIAAMRSQKHKLKAFTLSWNPYFDDPEPAFAKITAQHLGIAQEVLQEEDLKPFEGAESEEGRTPEPDDEIFFAQARRHYKRIAAHSSVVLAGDGGDDILTGQAWPYLVQLWQKREWREIAREFGGYFWTHKRIPPLRGGFRTRIRQLLRPEDSYAGYPEWLNDEFAKRVNLKQRWLDLKNRAKNVEHPLHPEAYEALHDGYWASVLEVEDAGWTRVRLETRAPLLDLRMLAFLLRLPPVPWCMNKELCRQAMRNALPHAVLTRPKTPLLGNPTKACGTEGDWIASLPRQGPGRIETFVNWSKWCETLSLSKGSLTWMILRPAGLFHWLKSVENR
jgi:asparagine synthase (glutamine-hydrolysing)